MSALLLPLSTRKKVIVSLKCLELWVDSLPGLAALPTCFTRLSDRVDGFEIQFGHADVLASMEQLKKRNFTPGWWLHVEPLIFELIRRRPHNCGHLENLQHLSQRSIVNFATGVNTLSECTGIKTFTVHPVGVSVDRWRSVVSRLGNGTRLSIENMSPRGREFSTLEEIAELLTVVPELQCTLDSCHLLQNGYSLDDARVLNFVDTFRERICVFHASWPDAPTTNSSGIKSSHVLCSGNMTVGLSTLLASMSHNTSIVIEGNCPPLREDLLLEEIMTFSLLVSAQKRAA